MAVENILEKLKEEGWNIKDDFLADLQNQSLNYQSLVKLLKNTDLKECGLPSLPSDLGKGKSSQIRLPVILQVTNVRNVAAPKAHEESGAAPRMLRITLTDGVNYVHGLEISYIQSLSLKTAPGTKLKLHFKINVAGSHLLLDPSNIYLIGGVVDELFEKWKLSQSVSKYCRAVNTSDGSGPPPWVPFGQKILVEREQDFKALGDVGVKKKDDDNFEHQRQKTVLELSKEGSQKVFGGGKQMLDSNVQKIINYGGFTIEEAEWALKKNKNDVHRAIQELKRAHLGGGGVDEYQSRSFGITEDTGKPRGGRRGRGRGSRGRGQAGPDGSDDEMPHVGGARPSGPASLLDYLESRILDKTESKAESPLQLHAEEKVDFFRNSRGRKRGRAEWRQKPATRQNEPPLAAENWPSLGQEVDIDSKRPPAQEKNIAYSYARDEIKSSYNHGISVNSHQNFSNFREAENLMRYSGQPSYKNTHSYRENNSSHYREKPSYYRDQQTSQQGSSYRDDYYHHHQPQHQSFYRNDTSNRYEESEKTDNASHYGLRKEEQNYCRRGMGRAMQRGDNSFTRGYSRGQDYYAGKRVAALHYNQQQGERGDYYPSEGNRNYGRGSSTNRVLSAKERELIADFEKSMVMSGVYESPTYSMQNSNNYFQAGNPNNYNYQEFSGTYEYHRGGDGYARRSRGRRGGRF